MISKHGITGTKMIAPQTLDAKLSTHSSLLPKASNGKEIWWQVSKTLKSPSETCRENLHNHSVVLHNKLLQLSNQWRRIGWSKETTLWLMIWNATKHARLNSWVEWKTHSRPWLEEHAVANYQFNQVLLLTGLQSKTSPKSLSKSG